MRAAVNESIPSEPSRVGPARLNRKNDPPIPFSLPRLLHIAQGNRLDVDRQLRRDDRMHQRVNRANQPFVGDAAEPRFPPAPALNSPAPLRGKLIVWPETDPICT